MLIQSYGALITEVCRLLGQPDLNAVIREIREVYRLPRGGASHQDNVSDNRGPNGRNVTASNLNSRLNRLSQWTAAWLIPICISTEVHTDPWNDEMKHDCVKGDVKASPTGGEPGDDGDNLGQRGSLGTGCQWNWGTGVA